MCSHYTITTLLIDNFVQFILEYIRLTTDYRRTRLLKRRVRFDMARGGKKMSHQDSRSLELSTVMLSPMRCVGTGTAGIESQYLTTCLAPLMRLSHSGLGFGAGTFHRERHWLAYTRQGCRRFWVSKARIIDKTCAVLDESSPLSEI